MREDLHVPLMQSNCGCTPSSGKCDEGKRLEGIVGARYRDWLKAYGDSARKKAHDKWTAAANAYTLHVRSNDRP